MCGKRECKMKTFFTVLFITAAVVFLVCIIFRGETPDKPKKNIKSDNPAILPYGKTGVLAHRGRARSGKYSARLSEYDQEQG